MLRREKDDPAVAASLVLLQPKVELTQVLSLTAAEEQRYQTARAGVFAAGAALHADQARASRSLLASLFCDPLHASWIQNG